MFASAGISGTVGRAFLLVGFIGAVFGAFAAFTGARRNDPQIIRLIPRFSTLSFAAAVGAFAEQSRSFVSRANVSILPMDTLRAAFAGHVAFHSLFPDGYAG